MRNTKLDMCVRCESPTSSLGVKFANLLCQSLISLHIF